MTGNVEFSPTLIVFFLIAIFFSLFGGLLLGYFVGRARNGQAHELDTLGGKFDALNDELDALTARVVEIESALKRRGAESLSP